VLDLALLEPGVTPHNNDDGGAGTYTLPVACRFGNFVLDGGVDNNLLSNGVVIHSKPDAVQEFPHSLPATTRQRTAETRVDRKLVTKSAATTSTLGVEFNRNDASAPIRTSINRWLAPDPLKRNQYGLCWPAARSKKTSYSGS